MILKRKVLIYNILLKRIKRINTKDYASCPCMDCKYKCNALEQSKCLYINCHKFNLQGKYRYHVTKA